AYVVEGRVTKVRGNPHSKANHGQICPRPHLAIQQMYDPDRVKTPMKRTNPKKGREEDPKFVPITWEEAIDTIADKMLELRQNSESEKFVLLRGRYSYMRDLLYGAVPKIFGSPNGISHSAICAEAEKFGSFYTEGYWGYNDFDLEHTKYVICWGADPVASNRQVPHAMSIWGHVVDNATLVTVDPRLSATAAKGKKWLPVIPGEDGALALAMAHVILTEGLWSKEFVGDFKDGQNHFAMKHEIDESMFNEVESHGVVKWWNLEVMKRTPEWAAPICGIPAEQIREVAMGFAKAAPYAISWVSPGASMQVRGGYSSMAAHALNGLVGSIDHKGGVVQGGKPPVSKTPSFKPYQDDVAKKHSKAKKIDQRGFKDFPAMKKKPGKGVVTNNTADAILQGKPYDVKVIIGYWNNFNFSCAGADRWDRALTKVPFFAHITTNIAEMTHFADIVLPAAFSMFEKNAYIKGKQNLHSYAGLQQRVVKPLWDVKMDESEVSFMLAQSLAKKGFNNLLEYYQAEFKDPETGKVPETSLEFTESALKFYTKPLWDGTKGAAKGDHIHGWNEFKRLGVWNTKRYKYKKHWGGKFKTKTKKFEFYSETLKKNLKAHAEKHHTNVDDIMKTCKYTGQGEYAFIPHHEPAYRWGDPGKYPLIFNEHRSRLNREGRSQNVPWYYELKDVDPGDVINADVAKINPITASKYGLENGDKIRITSPTGHLECTVKVWEGVRPGTVIKCYGQGHWNYGRIASADFAKKVPKGGSNNHLLPCDYDRFSGSTARHGGLTRVNIQKV
ncbi:MAG: molybdopterin-dependent oxidoreductase, partial [Bdellovibrionales bacterium]|nr:molybdopterin-dependent oxidoreductase [Bdellovibrionales bacterium]